MANRGRTCAPVKFRGHYHLIDALIFDFDGVIIDTETPDYETWQEVFESHGVALERSLWARFIGGGRDTFDVLQHLEDLAGTRVDREAVRQGKRERYLALIDASPLLPGVVDYIGEARRLGMKLGVASSSSVGWVTRHLSARHLLEEFDSVVGRDDVTAVKPDPELYRVAVSHLGTRAENALAIEDSANGLTAAKRAGLFCVAVANPMTEELPLDRADLRLRALSDISLTDLIERLERR